jgi:hypothetical protein
MLEEIKKIVESKDVSAMLELHRTMIKSWVSWADLKLNKSNYSDPVTLRNELTNVERHLDLINKYESFIDFVCELQQVFEENEMNK